MNNLAADTQRNVAVFLNDFDQEFADALEKLSKTLGRPVRGIILLDIEVKSIGKNTADKNGVFETIVCDYSDDAALRKVFKKLEKNLLFVTCSSERNQPYLARVLPHVPFLYGPTESSLGWATHKAGMREMLGSYDPDLIPNVQPVKKNTEEEIKKVLDKLKFPLIVKPTGLASSMLVSKVHNEAELRAALENGFSVIYDVYARDRGRGRPGFIVEEFIDGTMYSVDVYVGREGQVWPLPILRTKTAYAVGKEGFYVYQTDSHTTLTEKEIKAGHETAAKAVHALGLRSSVSHIELFHTATGWKIVELGPRAGGQRQDVYFTSYGVDHAYNEFLVKIGLEPELPTKRVGYCTTVNFYAEQEGIIKSIEGFEEAKNNPSMYRLMQDEKPGDMALLSNNGGKVVIKGIMANKNLEQLEKDAAFVRSTLKIITK